MHLRYPTDLKAKRAALLMAVESIRETVERHADEGEAKATLPAATVAAMAGKNLFALKAPACLGGIEADPHTQLIVIEALSAIEPSAGWCLMIGGTGLGLPGAFISDEAVATMFAGGRIPTGAIVSMPPGEAVPVDGGYRLTGRWPFVSGVGHSEWVTVGGRIANGKTPPEMRLFCLPTAQAHIHDNWQVAGLKGTGSCDVSVKDVFVPEGFTWDRFGKPNRGGPLYLLGQPGFVAIEHAAFALGVGRGALDTVMQVARAKRRSFMPAPASLEARPVFQRMVGLSDLKLRAARAVVLEVYAQAWDEVCAGRMPHGQLQAEMRSSTLYATQVAMEVTTDAFRYAGGSAAFLTSRLQRYLRDLNVGAQHLVVSDIAYENHGQFALGIPGADALR